MAYSQESLRQLFQQKFNLNNWYSLLRDFFQASELKANAEKIAGTSIGGQGYYLGTIDTTDNYRIGLFYYDIKDSNVARKKVKLRNLVKTFINPTWGEFDAALVVFDNKENWRLSFICDIKGENTAAKRYTYVFGDAENYYNTPVGRFDELQHQGVSFENIKETFSVEALTKQFYKDLFEWYQWAVSDEAGITFPNNAAVDDDDRENIDVKIIRMITRLMFVWFIKQKGIVPNYIFDISYLRTILKDFQPFAADDGKYYNAILQNLFFATLNRAIIDEDGKKRGFARIASGKDLKTLYRYQELFTIPEEEIIKIFAEVPFLNGGLFECLDKTRTLDGVEKAYYYDGFSRNDVKLADGRYKNRAFVPNKLFFMPEKGLFSILARYNFTIEENTPNEQQVALDPELLGKVFENLLGAYNPETKETARNQSGSFYTPREIVNYMVDESLQAYLGKTPVVMSLFSDDFVKDPAYETEYQSIAGRLKSIKVLDPACGSGAFPMGLLNRMVDLLQKIHTEESVYDLRLAIIENCIYGSDIQSIAAQITKLRFFISLICDCGKDTNKSNFGIPTLPNLETKFVAANSLIAKEKRAVIGNLFEDMEIEPTKKELAKTRHEHFSAKSASTKRRLRDKDQELREKLARLLSENRDFAPEDAKQLADWNPYDQNSVSRFFDSEWMFDINDGFDIVIGNPPYIQLQNNGGELAALYEDCGYKTFARTGDIYCLFYERGWQLLKPDGHLCYITSNKWMRAGYGEKTREFFANQSNPQLLIDFAGVKIFESATVDTNILLFSKGENKHETICAVTNKQNKDSVKNLSVFVQQAQVICEFTNSNSWVVLSSIEQSIKQKIEAIGTPLKDWDIQINYGIKTGLNEAFIIPTEKRDEILAACLSEEERKKTDALIRPILRGRDIKRYGYEWADLWLIATFPSRKYDIEEYPSVKQYLLSFGKERLIQSGGIGSRKKTNNKWFETQDSISYWEDFLKPKIIYPNMTKYMPFVLDKDGYYTNQKCFILTGDGLAYLTAFFNSNVFKICYRNNFPELQGGTRELSKIFFEDIKIPHLESIIEEDFEILVEDMQNGKDYADIRLEKALLLTLNLQDEEDYILNYKIQ
ncbi:Eco57I restriction-modification methylase domain-containing protein [Dysgonomonas termitidis]|uniref:site-specific DNA-methyltransferase (adenine-specific) n=1 Tax=Dysgonomonas termitidis TaxID=1516126 RepID=A0ABV9KSI6_9BACT